MNNNLKPKYRLSAELLEDMKKIEEMAVRHPPLSKEEFYGTLAACTEREVARIRKEKQEEDRLWNLGARAFQPLLLLVAMFAVILHFPSLHGIVSH